MEKIQIQTRSETTGLAYFDSLKKAIDAADKDNTIWKISWTITETNERVRLVKDINGAWFFSTLEEL